MRNEPSAPLKKKRSFNLTEDVSSLVAKWEQKHPGTKFTWLVNKALRRELAEFAGKRIALKG